MYYSAAMRQLLATMGLVVMLGPGCITERTANTAFVVGGRVAPTDATETVGGTVGGLGGTVSAAETDELFTIWGHADLFLGGNTRGWAGEAELAVEGGAAFFDGEHHLLLRGGFDGGVERNPYTGLMLLELPVATVGYQFHGQGESNPESSLHFDIGARGGLASAGRAFAADAVADFAGAPQLGFISVLLWEIVAARIQYDHIFMSEPWEVIRSEICIEIGAAICVDTRHLVADFEGVQREPAFVGITFGFGFATGYEWRSW